MFNPYYRPFSPGFRVRPQQEVPGFDIIDENSAVPSASRGRTSAPALEADLHENVRRAPSQLTDFAFPVAAGSDLGPRPFEADISQWLSPDRRGVNSILAKNPYFNGNLVGQTGRTGQYAGDQPSPSDNSPDSTFQIWAGTDRDAAWEKCHARCAKQTVDKGLRSDAPLLYRRCMRECMAESGYFDYLSPPNLP
jgi:hypothetical protein